MEFGPATPETAAETKPAVGELAQRLLAEGTSTLEAGVILTTEQIESAELRIEKADTLAPQHELLKSDLAVALEEYMVNRVDIDVLASERNILANKQKQRQSGIDKGYDRKTEIHLEIDDITQRGNAFEYGKAFWMDGKNFQHQIPEKEIRSYHDSKASNYANGLAQQFASEQTNLEGELKDVIHTIENLVTQRFFITQDILKIDEQLAPLIELEQDILDRISDIEALIEAWFKESKALFLAASGLNTAAPQLTEPLATPTVGNNNETVALSTDRLTPIEIAPVVGTSAEGDISPIKFNISRFESLAAHRSTGRHAVKISVGVPA